MSGFKLLLPGAIVTDSKPNTCMMVTFLMTRYFTLWWTSNCALKFQPMINTLPLLVSRDAQWCLGQVSILSLLTDLQTYRLLCLFGQGDKSTLRFPSGGGPPPLDANWWGARPLSIKIFFLASRHFLRFLLRPETHHLPLAQYRPVHLIAATKRYD